METQQFRLMCKDDSIQYRTLGIGYRHVFIRLDITTFEKFMPRSKGALQDKLPSSGINLTVI